MQLWTIQKIEAWDVLQQRGELQVKRDFADRDLLAAYDWMGKQMEGQIFTPSTCSELVPIWAWSQFCGARSKRPDLRSRWLLPSGTEGCLIEFNAPDDHVLLSDFDLWHYVLNFSYLATCEEDLERFESQYLAQRWSWNELPPAGIKSEIENSWQRIFDLDWQDPAITLSSNEQAIQATLWTLKSDWIARVDEFVAR